MQKTSEIKREWKEKGIETVRAQIHRIEKRERLEGQGERRGRIYRQKNQMFYLTMHL